MTDEELYVHLGRLIEVMPDLDSFGTNEDGCAKWLASAYAVIEAREDLHDKVQFKSAMEEFWTGKMYSIALASGKIKSIVLRHFAMLELKVAPASKGSFVPVGAAFDAFKAIGGIFSSATQNLLVVDPYLDAKIVTEYLIAVPEKVQIFLLSDNSTCKPDLPVAASKWTQQYQGLRPLSVRLSPARKLHDRLIVVDAVNVWTVTQSFKDFAARSPASIVRIDHETAKLKVAAYDDMWNTAQVVQ